jgi:hypothetical protein
MARLGFPLPEEYHTPVPVDGIPIAEADLLYQGGIVVWIQSNLHTREDVARRDEDQERQLKRRGYRIVKIWPDRMEEGLKDLAQRLGRPELMD